MSLRWTLTLALLFTALVPMAAALAVPLFQAERRAREDEASRLGLARRQAAVLVGRLEDDLGASAERALDDLTRVEADRRAVLRGPQAASRAVAEELARRHGLDGLIVSAVDAILAEALPSGVDGEALVRETPSGRRPVVTGSPPFLVAVRTGALPPGERVRLLALRAVTAADVDSVAAITGGLVTLRDAAGRRVFGDPGSGGGPAAVVPLGADPGGWTVRIEVDPADASRIRRDTLRTAAGIVPVAAVAALLVAALLAQRVSRPIRALAERADEVSRERAGAAFEVIEEPDEVRRLERAFERMLEGLEASEHRRVSAERIAAWQEVARRIAHEVKNPLSPIRVAVENLLRVRGRDPSALARAVEEEGAAILEEVESLRRLVDEFSAFARLPLPSFAPCDPGAVARQAVERISERAGRMHVAVELDTSDAPGRISADAEQLGRALRNVLENALDALEGAARKEIRVTVRRAGGRYGPMAEFEIIDSGEGLDAEARRRIFEPYFTTKGERGGTGLGMSIVYRIVAEHGGEAVADGSPGRGTVITLRVPERAASISG